MPTRWIARRVLGEFVLGVGSDVGDVDRPPLEDRAATASRRVADGDARRRADRHASPDRPAPARSDVAIAVEPRMTASLGAAEPRGALDDGVEHRAAGRSATRR